MITAAHILDILHGWAPRVLAWERDNIGLLVGSPTDEVTRILVCLDVTPAVVAEAIARNVDCIVAHHPIIFHPLFSIRTDGTHGRMLADLLQRGMSVIAMHTNADSAAGGVNTALAEVLSLTDTRPLRPAESTSIFLRVSAPVATGAEDALRAALDTAVRCVVRVDGNSIHAEVLCAVWEEEGLVTAVRRVVPDAWIDRSERRDAPAGYGLGAIGRLPVPLSVEEFLRHVAGSLGCAAVRHSVPVPGREIMRVAICGGSGSSLIDAAVRAGADAFVTADLTYHAFLDRRHDVLLVDAGHFETEQFFVDRCVDELGRGLVEKHGKIDILRPSFSENPVGFFVSSPKETP